MIKVYIQNKPLFLTDKFNNEIEEYLHRPDSIFMDELNITAVKTMVHELEQPEVYSGVFMYENLEELFDLFKSHFKVIVAAGGIVHTPENEVLLILRKGKWDLPKGKLDAGESLETCATREINEETGAKNLKVEAPLLITYHTYYEDKIPILKESHWFLISTETKENLTPQEEEDIEKCEWIPLKDLSLYESNMHASIRDVLEAGKKKFSRD